MCLHDIGSRSLTPAISSAGAQNLLSSVTNVVQQSRLLKKI